jgi:quaternary ammonium compound-resistance protein SugE
LGTALVALIGMIWLGEAATPAKLVSLGLIVAGVGGLSLAGVR